MAESSPQRPNDGIFAVTFFILWGLYGTGSLDHTDMGVWVQFPRTLWKHPQPQHWRGRHMEASGLPSQPVLPSPCLVQWEILTQKIRRGRRWLSRLRRLPHQSEDLKSTLRTLKKMKGENQLHRVVPCPLNAYHGHVSPQHAYDTVLIIHKMKTKVDSCTSLWSQHVCMIYVHIHMHTLHK